MWPKVHISAGDHLSFCSVLNIVPCIDIAGIHFCIMYVLFSLVCTTLHKKENVNRQRTKSQQNKLEVGLLQASTKSSNKVTRRALGALHVLYFLAVGSWVKWFLLSWERKNCLQSWTNSQNDNTFHSKRQPRTILSENNCHFENLLIFASSFFFLSQRKKNPSSQKLEDM